VESLISNGSPQDDCGTKGSIAEGAESVGQEASAQAVRQGGACRYRGFRWGCGNEAA